MNFGARTRDRVGAPHHPRVHGRSAPWTAPAAGPGAPSVPPQERRVRPAADARTGGRADPALLRRDGRRTGGAGDSPDGPASAMPLHPLLRPFASATLLRPLLRPFFSYSEGRRGVADAKGRSRRSTSRRGPLRASSKESIFRGLEDGAVPRPDPGSSLRSSPGAVRGSGRRGRAATMENGVLGGSFRPAPDCDFTRIAESCGTRRAHPGCPRERSSQSAKNRPSAR